MSINIAIDGPSGAGKSTLSRRLAKSLGFLYVDTGALYRAVGLYIYENGILPDDEGSVVKALDNVKVELKYADGEQAVILNGKNVSDDIRKHEISEYASKVSVLPEVRKFLFDTQRSIAKRNNVIMDGRDIGTVVLSDAQIKIYLTATAEDRAKRRFNELKERGQNVNFEQIYHDVIERDERDINREIAPLRQADDALLVDTTGFSFEKSYNKLLSIIKERLNEIL